ncbi:MAG TPA: Crp/Fnr family transcriptional regulator [Puia sp.]|jgi:CRP-like cAMP-binding protein
MENTLINFIQLFQPIPAPDQTVITSFFEPGSFKEGDYLFRGGKTCNDLFFVCSGIVRIVVINEKGVEVTHFFVKENHLCTILSSFNNQIPADESILAASDTEVLAITRSRLLTLYKELPYMKEVIDRITQQRLLDKIRTRNSYLGNDSATRYKIFLEQEPDIARRVPLKDIASYLGITPQSLSRIRKNGK